MSYGNRTFRDNPTWTIHNLESLEYVHPRFVLCSSQMTMEALEMRKKSVGMGTRVQSEFFQHANTKPKHWEDKKNIMEKKINAKRVTGE